MGDREGMALLASLGILHVSAELGMRDSMRERSFKSIPHLPKPWSHLGFQRTLILVTIWGRKTGGDGAAYAWWVCKPAASLGKALALCFCPPPKLPLLIVVMAISTINRTN